MNSQPRDDDHGLAEKLARLHENMLESTGGDASLEFEDDLRDEIAVLGLIERIKRGEGNAATDVDPSTKPANIAETFTTPKGNVGSADEDRLPEQIGRFQILDVLGQGGYGIVYLAVDPELGRQVAVKVPRMEAFLTSELRSRFIREAKIAAALSHPNIVTIFETGLQGSVCYLVSELVDGITLADWMADQSEPIDQRTAAELIKVLADALQHAHSRNVLHRDLKPANILIEQSDDAPLTPESIASASKIADFGLARIDGDIEVQTRTGALVGTPVYMSPEQMRDSSKSVTAATDIYSLGCILYEMLAGQRPFGGTGVLEVIQAVQTTDAKPIRSFRQDVSPDLEAICLKCLEKDPAARYASAYALQQDLENFLDAKPVVARRIGRLGRLNRWAKRNPALAAATSALALALIIGLTTVSLLLWRTNNLLTETEQMRMRAVDSATELQYAVDDMLTALVEMPEIESAGFEPVRAKLLERVNGYYEKFDEAQLDDPQLRRTYSKTLFSMANIRSRLGDSSGAIDSATQVLQMQPSTDESSATENQFRVDVLLFLAKRLGPGSAEQAQDYVDQALVVARSPMVMSEQDANLDLAITLTEVANHFAKQGESTLSRQYIEEAMQLWETIDRDQIVDEQAALAYGQALVSAALNNAKSENREDAVRYCDMAIDFFDHRSSETSATDAELFALARAHRVKGFVLGQQRDLAQAAVVRAIEILNELSIRHPAVSRYQITLLEARYSEGLNLYLRKNYEPSAEVLNSNIEFGNALIARFPEEESRILLRLSDNLTMLGIVLGYLNRHADQLETYYESKSIMLRRYADAEENNEAIVRTAGLDGEIGKCLNLLDRHEEAEEILQETIARLHDLLDRDPENGQAKRFLSNSYRWLADAFAKRSMFEQAIEAMNQRVVYDVNNGPFAESHHIAQWQLHLGDTEAALQSVTEFRDYCATENRPFTFAELANELLVLCDTLIEQGHLTTQDSSSLRRESIQMALAMFDQALSNTQTRDENLARIDNSDQLIEIRQTETFQHWRPDQN